MFTPKRPDATCLIAERRRSPFGSGVKRDGSSPPSPVFDLPPRRFIAIASVSCTSRPSEPSDIAPVEKRLTISAAGSTSSSGMPPSPAKLKSSRPRSVALRAAVGRDRRDPHLRDRLQERLRDSLDRARLRLFLRHVEDALGDELVERL